MELKSADQPMINFSSFEGNLNSDTFIQPHGLHVDVLYEADSMFLVEGK